MSGKESELSILFAGVSGSSRLYEKLGKTEALHAVDRCLKRMERGVDGFRGRIVKTVGDELMAVFPTPDDALQAAGEMQQRVGDLPPVSGVKLAIRVGFHHGAVREEGGEVLGESVTTAAHLAGLAKAGQVLTSAATQAVLSPLQQLSTRGLDPLALKDRADGLRVFEVVWQDAADFGLPSAPRPAGRGADGRPKSAASCQTTSKTRRPSALSFSASGSRPRVDSCCSGERTACVAALVSTCPAFARPARCAAVVTLSPSTSPPSSRTAPWWKPTRIASLTPDTGGRSPTRCCISPAACRASSGVGKTAISSSPTVLTMRPRKPSTPRSMRFRQRSTACSASVLPSFSYNRELPETPANRMESSLSLPLIDTAPYFLCSCRAASACAAASARPPAPGQATPAHGAPGRARCGGTPGIRLPGRPGLI